MAKVKILESCAGLNFSYAAKEVVEENDHTQGLINAGLAEWVEPVKTEEEQTEPVETETPALDSEQPVETETPALDSEQPVETETPNKKGASTKDK